MVLGRLDVVNEREKQVRKFYQPIPKVEHSEQRPWPRRHRFADVMEPGDVVRTMSKNQDDWDADSEHTGQNNKNKSEPEDSNQTQYPFDHAFINQPLEAAARPSRQSTTTENQPLLGYVSKVERKLKKSIEMDVEERRKSLRAQLQREMKPTDEPAESDNMEPLFKPARATASARKRLDISAFCTDPASSRVSPCFSRGFSLISPTC
jgi:hypothetical protein